MYLEIIDRKNTFYFYFYIYKSLALYSYMFVKNISNIYNGQERLNSQKYNTLEITLQRVFFSNFPNAQIDH